MPNPALAPVQPKRYLLPDLLRACAVMLMIGYHLVFDLTQFGLIDPAVMTTTALHVIQRLCMCSFLFCVGWSLAIAQQQGINWHAFWRREARLIAAALTVSVVTYWALPKQWIFFGILHFIALVSVLLVPLVKRPVIALVLALLVLIPYVIWNWQLPWFNLPHLSADYVPLTPWVGWVLLGIAVYPLKLHELGWQSAQCLRHFSWLGRHSLAIYLLHQPLLWGLVWGVKQWLL